MFLIFVLLFDLKINVLTFNRVDYCGCTHDYPSETQTSGDAGFIEIVGVLSVVLIGCRAGASETQTSADAGFIEIVGLEEYY